MRNFAAETETALAAEVATIAAFVEMDFSTTYRFNGSDIDMYFGANKFEKKPMEVPLLQLASDLSVDRCTIRMGNAGRMMSAALQNNDETGSEVIISIGAIGSDHRIIDLEPMFTGELTAWDFDEKWAPMALSGRMARWSKKTLRIAQASCPWPWKGAECGYSGAGADCRQTWSRCNLLGNGNSFGGFVYLSKLQEARIWWGRPT